MPDPSPAEIAQLVIERQRRQAGTPSSKGDLWPEPILPGTVRVPDISATLLPTWCGAYAAAVARSTQTPSAMAVLMTLSVLAAVLQRRFEVAPFGDDYTEPLALWTLTALPSGSRKTAVIKALTEVLVTWEKLERDRAKTEIARTQAVREVIAKRIEKLKGDAGKEDDPERRVAIQEEIRREKVSTPPEMFAPRLFSGDITAERLQQLMVEQDERAAVLSDEGGIFTVMAGAYSGGMASLDVFLQGHAGMAMRVDRAGRMAHLDRPALSFGLALQPGILQDTGKARRFRESGLMARFIYAVPRSNVGARDVRDRYLIDAAVRDEWGYRVLGLLQDMHRPIGKSRVIAFDAEARELWLDLAAEIEREQGEGGRFEHMADWTSKLPGAVARIAGLLAIAEHGTELAVVDAASVQRACELGRLLIPHAEAAFRLMGAEDAEGDALALLAWVRRYRLSSFTQREAHRAHESRMKTVARVKVAVAQLIEWHIVSAARMESESGTGRKSATHYVNPRLFVDLP